MKSIAWVLALGLILASRGLPADSGQSGTTLGQVDVEDAADAPTNTAPPAGTPVDQDDVSPASVDLGYHPVPPTDALSLRQSCWESLRISQVKPDGKVLRGGLWLSGKEAGHYYRNADAPLAVSLNRKALGYDIQGSVWMIASPVVGLVVGAYGGLVNVIVRYDTRNSDGTYSNEGNYSDSYIRTRAYQEALVGGAVGFVLGAAIGFPMGLMDCRKAESYRQNAADTFNRKLLQDLQLYAVPKPGGGELGIQKQF